MKIVWLRRFVNFKLDKTEENFGDKSAQKKNIFQKVVKFEDFEKINKSLAIENMDTTSSKNQYLAALTGWF